MKIPSLDRSKGLGSTTADHLKRLLGVGQWLFRDDVGHREMDSEILGLDPSISKGWQSMGVLHYLGPKAVQGRDERREATELLAADNQDFRFIIELLNKTTESYQENLIAELTAVGEKTVPNFKKNY